MTRFTSEQVSRGTGDHSTGELTSTKPVFASGHRPGNLAIRMDQRDLGAQFADHIAQGLTVEHLGELVQFSKLVRHVAAVGQE
ncbi:hypothetical protein ACH40E_13925 [Streptomyces acidicola]|uniref:hypothetical protein n=1 Tax=Streptomyces acidicola TaxID=2596892 RepID=UPI0037BB5073